MAQIKADFQAREKERELLAAEAEQRAVEEESILSTDSLSAEFMTLDATGGTTPKLPKKENSKAASCLFRDVTNKDSPALSKSKRISFQTNEQMQQRNREDMPEHCRKTDRSASPTRTSSGTVHYTEVGDRYLPKPAIEKFTGDPLDYWAFVNRFTVHIADRIASDDLKLVYLLQHCSKPLYEKVKHCASGPDKRLCYKHQDREILVQPPSSSRCSVLG